MSKSTPPEGRQCWTMQLLADRLVQLGKVENISNETVRRVLKKRHQALAEATLVFPVWTPSSCVGWRHVKVTVQRTREDFAVHIDARHRCQTTQPASLAAIREAGWRSVALSSCWRAA